MWCVCGGLFLLLFCSQNYIVQTEFKEFHTEGALTVIPELTAKAQSRQKSAACHPQVPRTSPPEPTPATGHVSSQSPVAVPIPGPRQLAPAYLDLDPAPLLL